MFAYSGRSDFERTFLERRRQPASYWQKSSLLTAPRPASRGLEAIVGTLGGAAKLIQAKGVRVISL
jgi:hypothetical protein